MAGSRTFDEELLLWLGDESTSDRAADADRIRDIAAEFAMGFDRLSRVGAAVTVFGSARTPPDHPHYALMRAVGAALGRVGLSVITGGGDGVMEAANRGAKDAGALSVGCNIELPHEQRQNDYLDIALRFRHFPLVLVGEGEWEGLLDWLRARALADHRIEPSDLAELRVVGDPDEVARVVVAARERQLQEAGR